MLLAASLAAPAGAQSLGMQPALDRVGRFTIEFPAGWQVQTSEDDKPAMVAVGPSNGGNVRPNVNVVIETLHSPVTSEAFAQLVEPTMRAVFNEFTIVQEGRMQIAGLPAYYRYYTWRANSGAALYQVQVYVTTVNRGFVITGTTQNDPDHIRTDIPVILRIIESFRPSLPRQ